MYLGRPEVSSKKIAHWPQKSPKMYLPPQIFGQIYLIDIMRKNRINFFVTLVLFKKCPKYVGNKHLKRRNIAQSGRPGS
jgi:hypothetical protein